MHKVKEVAAIFNVTPQTIRNWVSHPLLSEFFSPEARRRDGEAYAQFFASDIEVCNTIHTGIRQKDGWQVIANRLRAGDINKKLPARAALLNPAVDNDSHLQTVAHLAIERERRSQDVELITRLEAEVDDLRRQIHDLEEKAHSLELQLKDARSQATIAEAITANAKEIGRMERELELLKQGWRPPAEG